MADDDGHEPIAEEGTPDLNDESRHRRPLPRSVWILGFLWLAATAGAVLWGISHEEDDLTDRAAQALDGQSVSVDFVGRDAHISGLVSTAADLDRAVATARQVWGVRRVESDGVSIAAGDASQVPTEMSPPFVAISIEEGNVVMSGTVPDPATADAIIRAARARWGGDNVADQLIVGSNTSGAAWLAGITRAIDGLDALESAQIEVDAGGVSIRGDVASEDIRRGIEESLTSAFGADIAIDNQLLVADLADPSFEAELIDGGIVLRGLLPDRETVDAIVAGAVGVYGSSQVTDQMIVGPATASPGYLTTLPSVFGAIDGLNPWRLSLVAGKATITGLAVSDSAIAGTVDRLTSALGTGGLSLESELEVDPSAVAAVLTELLQGTATFEVASARLSAEAMVLLDSAIEILQDNPTTVLTVEGHTDDVGTEEDNRLLSEARAQAVVDYLVAGGVAEERLAAVGFGESQPIADNGTADGRSENRRIQFVVEQGDS
ncbi:MAG: OmpA family protein [bacterium]|nr:OmpA family protein [bacterium]